MILSAIALHIYTFIDVLRTDRSQLPARLPKVAWAVLTLIVPILGHSCGYFSKISICSVRAQHSLLKRSAGRSDPSNAHLALLPQMTILNSWHA